MQVTVVDRKGVEHWLKGERGKSLMLLMFHAGLPISAECGGCCVCATCHVHVDAAWFDRLRARGEEESAMLDLATDVRATSRLSCQIELNEALDGLRVTLAPES